MNSVSDAKMKEIILEKYMFSEDFVNDLSYEDLQKYYKNSYQILNSTKTETYFKFEYDMSDPEDPKEISQTKATKIEYELSLNQPAIQTKSSNGYDCIQENWLKLETYISKTSSTEGNVSARFHWLKVPRNERADDVFSIGLNSNFSPVPGSESAYFQYETKGKGETTTKDLGTPATKRDIGGYAYIMDTWSLLYPYYPRFGPTADEITTRGYMQYDFIANNSVATVIDAYSHYAHQIKGKYVSVSVSIPLGGSLSISSSEKFDIMTGHAQLKW